jgi:hypothetical protein
MVYTAAKMLISSFRDVLIVFRRLIKIIILAANLQLFHVGAVRLYMSVFKAAVGVSLR